MPIKILNQPLSDLQFLNVNETVYFYHENSGYYTEGTQGTSGTSGSQYIPALELYGTEKYEWNYDSGNVTPDKPIQITTGPDPVYREVSFQNPGSRTVQLKIYDAGTSGSVIFDQSLQFDVYKFPSEIIGPEFVQVNQTGFFQTIEAPEPDVTYKWYINGVLEKTANLDSDPEPHKFAVQFINITRASIRLVITHGNGEKILQFVCVVSRGNATFGRKYESDISPKLMFFNKEGDCLNFNYNEYDTDRFRWEGDMLFHVNSNDTFKTQALYIFENVAPVTLDIASLKLDKFQLFNQYGIDFQPTKVTEEIVENIEAVNNSSDFYTKWVYGNNFHLKFPVGSEVYFENIKYYNIVNDIISTPLAGTTIPDFNSFPGSGIRTFTVLATKQDAVLVLTSSNNSVFNTNYDSSTNYYTYSTTTRIYKTAQGALVNIQPGKIVGLNIVKVFNTDLYTGSPSVDEELNPEWNENGFEYLLYDNKKVTILNSQKNDGVYTVSYKDNDLSNKLLTKYYKIDCISLLDLMPHPKMGFKIDLTFRTTKIQLSSEPVDFISRSNTAFLLDKNLIIYEALPNKDFTPGLLRPNVKFQFEDDGSMNPNFSSTYTCVKVDTALNLLTPNNTDTTGWSIRMYNTNSYSSIRSLVRFSTFIDTLPLVYSAATRKTYNNLVTFRIIVNNKSIYNINLKEIGFNFETGNMNSLLVALQNYINTNIQGLGAFFETDHVRIFEFPGYSITKLSFGWQFGFSIKHNTSHSSKLPGYGLVGNELVSLNTSDYDGFIYRRTSTKTVHIFRWDSINMVPLWYTMGENKKLVWVDTPGTVTYQENVLGNAFLVDTKLSFEQSSDLTDVNLARDIQAFKFVNTYQRVFESYGLELFVDGNDLCIARTQQLNSTTEDYFKIDFYSLTQAYFTPVPPGETTVSYPTGLTSGTAGMDTYTKIYAQARFQNVEMFEVTTPVKAEKNHKIGVYERPASISENYQRKIEIRDIDKTFGLNIRINGINYDVTYDDIFDNALVGFETIDSTRGDSSQAYLLNDLIDIQETLMDWGNQQFTLSQDITPDDTSEVGLKYYKQLESLGIIIYLERSSFFDPLYSSVGGAAYGERPYDTIVIESKYPNVPITFDVVGAIDYRIKNMEIEFLEIGQTLTISINSIRYPIDRLSATEPIAEILERWVDAYSIPLREIDIVADHYYIENYPYNRSNNLLLYTLDDKTRVNVQVWTGKNSIPGNETFIINDYSPGKEGIIISGNEIVTTDPNVDLQAAGLATAMIIAITGSKFPLNNQEYNIIHLDPDRVGLSYQGPFWPTSEDIGDTLPQRVPGFDWEDLADPGDISLSAGTSGTSGTGLFEHLVIKSREFLRYPREGFDGDKKKKLLVRWDDDDQDDSMFFYDFSGTQLDVVNQGVYSYTGVKPLFADDNKVLLNSVPNRDLTKLNVPSAQQTIFETLTHEVELIDSETDITPEPEPLQLFIGYRGDIEGVNTRTLIIERIEDINVTITTEPSDKTKTFLPWVNILNFDSETNELTLTSNRGELVGNMYKPFNFLTEGFMIGHRVKITGTDTGSSFNQKSFKNNGFIGEIEVVGVNKIKFKDVTVLQTETSYSLIKNSRAPFNQIPAGLTVTISVVPQQIAKVEIYGQTEIEDERLVKQLNIVGGKILHRDVFIFKEYDIQEAGIDWIFLNEKRKEMLLIRPEIYNYISSYKAIIHAINYFGYNDLSFNEYYLNIDQTSSAYGKLQKIEIPDLFNNSVPGWNENDFIKKTLPNPRFQKTNLFNLTYRITDKEGNNILSYSLDEVIIKLLGLKRWLQEQTLPPGKRIKDITGVGEDTQTTYIRHDVRKLIKTKSYETISPVVVSKVEIYQQPVINAGETYNVNLKFEVGDMSFKPDYYHLKITTFASDPDINTDGYKLIPVQTKNEYRTDLSSYNFAVDRYVDPFIMVEIFSDNGYGANYRFRKTYNIEPLAFVKQ